jgi:hypothetical protein
MPLAQDLLTQRVVTGLPFQRLEWLSEQIVTSRAQFCVVIKPRSLVLLGLIRFSDIETDPATSTRILADLMRAPPACRILETDTVERLVNVLLTQDPEEIVVEGESGAFVGLITPESFMRWLIAEAPIEDLDLNILPRHSRWSPNRQSPEKKPPDLAPGA